MSADSIGGSKARAMADLVAAGGRKVESRLRGPAWTGRRIRRQVESIRRLSAQGERDVAIEVARRLLRDNPMSALAHIALSDALIAAPTTFAHAEEARVLGEQLLALRSERRELAAYSRVLSALAFSEPPTSETAATALMSFVAVAPQERIRFARQHLRALNNAGRGERAAELAAFMARTHRSIEYWTLAHDFACRSGSLDLAESLEKDALAVPMIAPDDVVLLAADRSAASGCSTEALAALEALRPERSAGYSQRLVDLLLDHGRPGDALDFLATTRHNLTDGPVLLAEYDALVATGDMGAASTLIDGVAEDALEDASLFTRLRDNLDWRAVDRGQLLERVREYRNAQALSSARVDNLATLYFELDALEELGDLVQDPAVHRLMGALGLYNEARYHYVRRSFEAAEAAIDRLAGTVRHWEGEKLRSRILLEQGRFSEAIDHRARYPRGRSGLDEVVYHALLQLRRYDEAFGMYLSAADRSRFGEVFGSRLECGDAIPSHVAHRVVVPQGGPGDEILCAGLYPYLADRSDRLTALCDPRLASLLRRSYPEVEFLPAERRSSRSHPGFSAPDQPSRAVGPLFDLVDEASMGVALTADAVMPGRAMFPVAYLSGVLPFAPSLRPDESRLELLASRLGAAKPSVGVVWRSEYNTAMRSIHYCSLAELEPMFAVDAQFVCLQHDATESERDQLSELAGDRVLFVDDLDLRDDFETAAALVASLDAVVGVGTTPVELGAAVGTATVSLQPTHFSSWRDVDGQGTDFWHRTARIAAVEDAGDRSACARKAADWLRALPWR